jgi:hypothetical protein
MHSQSEKFLDPFYQKCSHYLKEKKGILFSKFPFKKRDLFWLKFFGPPLVPLIFLCSFIFFSRFSLHETKKLFSQTQLRLTKAFMEKTRYENFLKNYPQKTSFLEELEKRCQDNPPLEKLLFQNGKILKQKLLFGPLKTKISRPYIYQEKGFAHPILMDQKDFLAFLKKVEEEFFVESESNGAGELFFPYFHIKKTKNPYGTFFLVDAKICEKRGVL